ncbi:MAG: hypothetical protein KA250_13565 [Verrucomicrobiales bacterium]|nr:hypothetical protein [Verrucomicrobiales bacterium]
MSKGTDTANAPTSILKDKQHLWVLVWLDRAGLTTDEAIARNLSLEERDVNRILLDLHQKGLVDYNDKWLRINDSGKDVLDNLGLDQKIIGALISQLKVPSRYRSAFSELIQQYRDSSHRAYLDTLCSLDAYSRYQEYFLSPESATKDYSEFKTTAHLGILIRDLRNWMTHSIGALPAQRKLENAKPSVQPLAIIIHPSTSLSSLRYSKFRESMKLWLWSAEALDDSERLSLELTEPSQNLYYQVYLSFNDLQRRVDKDSWFSSWVGMEHALSRSLWSRKVGAVHQYCKAYLEEETSFTPVHMEKWWHKSLRNYLAPAVTGFDCNVLGQLLAAESIEGLAKDLGLSLSECELLLRRIYSKSRALLEDPNKRMESNG